MQKFQSQESHHPKHQFTKLGHPYFQRKKKIEEQKRREKGHFRQAALSCDGPHADERAGMQGGDSGLPRVSCQGHRQDLSNGASYTSLSSPMRPGPGRGTVPQASPSEMKQLGREASQAPDERWWAKAGSDLRQTWAEIQPPTSPAVWLASDSL